MSAQTPSFVPGQVLLKFADGTSGHQAVVAASRANRVDLDVLVNAIHQLGERVGIPLAATSIGSGNWVVLSVDTAVLTHRLETWLEARADVRTVERQTSSRALVLTPSEGSPLAEAARTARAGRDEALNRLMGSWGIEVGIPLVGQPAGSDDLAISVNLAQATLDVVAKLKVLPDVAAVQPNYAQTRRPSA